jgi:GT2 family glycosyltransferase
MDLGGVSVIVLNWRTPEHTIRAVRALLADGVPPERVLVVDNASGDDSVEQIRAAVPAIGLLATEANLGFARANNVAARALPADRAYLFVNSDAFVHRPGSVQRLGTALEEPRVGIAVPRLRNPSRPSRRSPRPCRSSSAPPDCRASFPTNGSRGWPPIGTMADHERFRPPSARC